MGLVRINRKSINCFLYQQDSIYANLPAIDSKEKRLSAYQIKIYSFLAIGSITGYFLNPITDLFLLWCILAFSALAAMALIFVESEKTSYQNSLLNYNLSKTLFLLIFFIIGYGRYCYVLQSNDVYIFSDSIKQARITGIAKNIVPKSGNRWSIELILEKIYDKNGQSIELAHKSEIKIRLNTKNLYEQVYPGDRIAGIANIFPLPRPLIPGEHDFARDLWFEQISGVGYFTYGPNFVDFSTSFEDPFFSFELFFNKLRQELYHFLQRHFSEKRISGFVYALLSGISGGIDKATLTDLRNSGLSHILAVSGFHMSIVMGGLFWILRFFGSCFINFSLVYPVKKLAALFSIIFGIFYLSLADFAISASRAWIMTSIMFLAILFDRKAFQLHNIVLAGFVIIFIWPQSLFQPGFQMSFLIVLSIICAHELGIFKMIIQTDEPALEGWVAGFLGKLWKYFKALFVISSIASIVASPIILLHFKTLNTLSILANIIVIPCFSFIVMPALFLGILFLFLGLPIADTLLSFESFALEFILSVASYINSFSYASLSYSDIDNFWLYMSIFSITGFCFSSASYKKFYVLLFASSFLVAVLLKPDYDRLLISPKQNILAFRSVSHSYCSFGRGAGSRFLHRNWKNYLGTKSSGSHKECPVKIIDNFCYIELDNVNINFKIEDGVNKICYPQKMNDMFLLNYSFIDDDSFSSLSSSFSALRGSVRLFFTKTRGLEVSFVDAGNLFLEYSSKKDSKKDGKKDFLPNFYPWRFSP